MFPLIRGGFSSTCAERSAFTDIDTTTSATSNGVMVEFNIGTTRSNGCHMNTVLLRSNVCKIRANNASRSCGVRSSYMHTVVKHRGGHSFANMSLNGVGTNRAGNAATVFAVGGK